MAPRFGSGIHLDEKFDFSVGNTGDLKSEDGLEELQKDLSIQMVIGLDQYLGQPPGGNLEAKIINKVITIANADPRITSVVESSIDVQFNSSRDELTIKMTVRTSDGEQNLIFDV